MEPVGKSIGIMSQMSCDERREYIANLLGERADTGKTY